jgi:hypothetical protein
MRQRPRLLSTSLLETHCIPGDIRPRDGYVTPPPLSSPVPGIPPSSEYSHDYFPGKRQRDASQVILFLNLASCRYSVLSCVYVCVRVCGGQMKFTRKQDIGLTKLPLHIRQVCAAAANSYKPQCYEESGKWAMWGGFHGEEAALSDKQDRQLRTAG